MHELEELFDEEYDLWEDQQQDDYFDYHADEMYEQYVSDYYQAFEDNNKFVLIYDTSTVKEYIVPGTNVHKIEQYENNKLKTVEYFKECKKEN